MIEFGLVSIIFKNNDYKSIISIAKEHNLDGIEWNSNIHIPLNDLDKVNEIYYNTIENNLKVFAYNSYYKLGISDSFDNDIMNAKALHTNIIRIWAYNKNSELIKNDEYKKIVNDAKNICLKNKDFIFCLEMHNNSLTNDYKSIIKFLNDVNCPNLKLYWQINQLKSFNYNKEALLKLLPYIISIHIFNCDNQNIYHPLIEIKNEWNEYLTILKKAPLLKHISLEFTSNGLSSLKEDITVIKEIFKKEEN